MGEFEEATSGGIWVAIRGHTHFSKVIAVVALLLCSNSFAFTGDDLQKAIQLKQQNDVKTYITGVVDGYRRGALDIGITASVEAITRGEKLNGVALSQRGTNCFKFPEKTSHEQTFDVVRKFLSENPKIRHKEAADLVLDALSGAFPCK